jgi:uncharacterized protein (TIGR00304 family)
MLDLVLIGIGIILVGFLVVFLATAVSGRSQGQGEEQNRVRGGGVIMIGPIPIVFGTDAKWASIAMVLAIVLIVLVLLSWVLVGR